MIWSFHSEFKFELDLDLLKFLLQYKPQIGTYSENKGWELVRYLVWGLL